MFYTGRTTNACKRYKTPFNTVDTRNIRCRVVDTKLIWSNGYGPRGTEGFRKARRTYTERPDFNGRKLCAVRVSVGGGCFILRRVRQRTFVCWFCIKYLMQSTGCYERITTTTARTALTRIRKGGRCGGARWDVRAHSVGLCVHRELTHSPPPVVVSQRTFRMKLKRFWSMPVFKPGLYRRVTEMTPAVTTFFLEGANAGQLYRMWTEHTAKGQNMLSWMSVGLALVLWVNFYAVTLPRGRARTYAIWATAFGIVMNASVIATVFYFRYVV